MITDKKIMQIKDEQSKVDQRLFFNHKIPPAKLNIAPIKINLINDRHSTSNYFLTQGKL